MAYVDAAFKAKVVKVLTNIDANELFATVSLTSLSSTRDRPPQEGNQLAKRPLGSGGGTRGRCFLGTSK